MRTQMYLGKRVLGGLAGVLLGLQLNVGVAQEAQVQVLHEFSALDGIQVGIDETALRQNDHIGNTFIGEPILVEGWFYGLGFDDYATIDREHSHHYLYRVSASTGAFERLMSFPDLGQPAALSVTRIPGLSLGSDGYLYGLAPANMPNYYHAEVGTRIDTHGSYIYRFLPGPAPVVEKLHEFAIRFLFESRGWTDRDVLVPSYAYPDGLPISPLVEGPGGAFYGLLTTNRHITAEGLEINSGPEREAYYGEKASALYRFVPGHAPEVLQRFEDAEAQRLLYVAQTGRLYGTVQRQDRSTFVFEIAPDGSGYRELYQPEPAFESKQVRSDEFDAATGWGTHANVPHVVNQLIWSPSRQTLLAQSQLQWTYQYLVPGQNSPLSEGHEELSFFSIDPGTGNRTDITQYTSTPPTNFRSLTGTLVEDEQGDLYGTFRFGGTRLIDEQSVPPNALTPKNVRATFVRVTGGSGGIFRITPDNRFEEQYRFGLVEVVPIAEFNGAIAYAWRNIDGMFPRGLTLASDGSIYGINEFGGQRLNGNLFRFTPGEPLRVTPGVRMTLRHVDASPVNPVDQLVAGQRVTLTWQAELGGDGSTPPTGECQATGHWLGSRPLHGTEVLDPGTTPGVYTYTLTCPGLDGPLTQTKTVQVNAVTPEPVRATGGGGASAPWLLLALSLIGAYRHFGRRSAAFAARI